MKRFLDSILKDDVQEFIWNNEQADVQELLLKHKTIHEVPAAWVAQQIAGRKKVKHKLPTWYRTKGIVYPPAFNLEQSSSEATARFKHELIQNIVPPALDGADLTGGFGVDAYFLGQGLAMNYVEPNEDLLQLVRHNHLVLGANNIRYHACTAEDFLQTSERPLHSLYLDPSRRKASQKVFKLEDCTPNPILLRAGLFAVSSNILLKTSPLYDIVQGCKELQHVARVIVVAVENECKELLFLLQKDFHGEPTLQAVDLYPKENKANTVSFLLRDEREATVEYASPQTYLYEPNAAILKAGAFKWIAQRHKLFKLAPNTHLYTSDQIVDFSGRIFKIRERVHLDKKLVSAFEDGYANILVRNYPMSVEEIKKKTGLKEGGKLFLICSQSEKEKHTMIAERIDLVPTAI